MEPVLMVIDSQRC